MQFQNNGTQGLTRSELRTFCVRLHCLLNVWICFCFVPCAHPFLEVWVQVWVPVLGQRNGRRVRHTVAWDTPTFPGQVQRCN